MWYHKDLKWTRKLFEPSPKKGLETQQAPKNKLWLDPIPKEGVVHSYRKIILKDLKNRFASLYICVVKCAIAIFAHDLSLNFCEMERAHHKSSFVRQHLYQIQNITTYIFLNSSILIQKDLKHFVICKVWLGAEQNYLLIDYIKPNFPKLSS